MLAAAQPEGVLEILDARLAPGLADQWQMAAAVASHFASTPHTVDQAAGPSPLGRLETLKFRVRIDLAVGAKTVKGVEKLEIACPIRQPLEVAGHPTK